jgi:hypothetical protein
VIADETGAPPRPTTLILLRSRVAASGWLSTCASIVGIAPQRRILSLSITARTYAGSKRSLRTGSGDNLTLGMASLRKKTDARVGKIASTTRASADGSS